MFLRPLPTPHRPEPECFPGRPVTSGNLFHGVPFALLTANPLLLSLTMIEGWMAGFGMHASLSQLSHAMAFSRGTQALPHHLTSHDLLSVHIFFTLLPISSEMGRVRHRSH